MAEALLAGVALVRLLLRVDVRVVSQVILSSETLSTDVARERSLVCVSSLVDHHVVTFGELSMAELADKPLLGPGASGMSKVESWII